MEPLTAAECRRAEQRQHVFLQNDRVVRHATRDNRYKLLEVFRGWLENEKGVAWSLIFDRKPLDPEEVASWLVQFGREMHRAGKAYGRYSETINAISMIRPSLKKSLSPAWDLAFSWLEDEPHAHHPALPLSVLLAMVSLSLLWGWPVEASIWLMAWIGLLRIGEVLDATRSDLLLPEDSAPGIEYILVKIREPKTRGRGARHQSTRIEPKDAVSLISEVFKDFAPSDRLWSFSASTLRKRFVLLQTALGLPIKPCNGARPFDLGSLRPGGATHLLTLTEDISLVQRRGRWASIHVMNIYLQEIAVATCIPRLQSETRDRIEQLSQIFGEVLEQSLYFLKFKIPTNAWNLLFRSTARETD